MVLARWTAHPARRRPRDLALVVAVVFLTAGAVLASLESLFLTALAIVFLVVAVAPFLFPTHFEVTDTGVSERRMWRHKARSFADLRRLQVGPGAVLLSPFGRRHWLERHRGIVLLFDGADREHVIAVLEERMATRAAGETAGDA